MNRLTVDRWRQIDTLFSEALERPPDERTAFLRHACGRDRDLYEEIVSLLESDARAEEVLGESATQFAFPLMAALEAELDTLNVVGPYRLIESLGRGGMGAVYLAERADGQFDRRVALKLVKRGMDSEEIVRRFRMERQILASLQHPHIAQLHDGGIAEDGRPYLVMEYVEGTPIDRYCDERQLGIEERLRLFLTVCDAVQYAHRSLVIHRDLKPGNILVTSDGQVKLLDFGIAKLLDDDGAGVRTRTGAHLLTPAYAAPEQISQLPVTTSTDVYSLGVVLYELLTGQRPSDVPARPSSIVADENAKRLQRRLQGDLDTIILKALRHEPERRYGSAQQLLDDLRRHLDGLPVLARPDTLRYRARKFVRRHRFGAAATTGFALFLVVSAVAMAVQQRATARERDAARVERDKAEEVAAFLESLLASADPFAPERLDTLRVRDLLERGVNRIQNELTGRPLVQAQMLNTVGRVSDGLGDYDEALALLHQSLAIRIRWLGSENLDVAESLADLGWVHYNDGMFDLAEARLREALTLRRRLHPGPHEQVAESMRILGTVLQARGDLDAADSLMRGALSMYREVHGEEHTEVATSMGTLASLVWDRGDYVEAEALLRESLDLRRKLYGDDHPGLAIGLHNLGTLLRDVKRYDEAEEALRTALAINRQALGPEHRHVVDNLNVLASVLRGKGDLEAAEPVFKEVLALRRRILGPEHPGVSITLDSYAALLKARGDLDGAERLELEAIAIARKAYGDEHFAVALTTSKLAGILRSKGDIEGATRLFRDSLALMERVLGPKHVHTSLTRLALAECLAEMFRFEEAEAFMKTSYEILLETQDDRFIRQAAANLVTLYEKWGRSELAAEYRAVAAD